MIRDRNQWFKPFILAYEGDGDADQVETPDDTKSEDTKTFTQDQVNKLLAADKRKLREQNQKLAESLKELQGKIGTTAEEKEELQERIEQLENSHKSESQLQKEKAEKESKKTQALVEDLRTRGDKWKGRFTSQLVDTALLSAAQEQEAYNPSQVVDLLRGKTVVEEVEDGGKKTGQFRTIVNLEAKDDNGGPVILKLTPSDALARMKENQDLFGNLFKSGVKKGIGGSGSGDSGSKNQVAEALKDHNLYRKLRKENPELLGLASSRR